MKPPVSSQVMEWKLRNPGAFASTAAIYEIRNVTKILGEIEDTGSEVAQEFVRDLIPLRLTSCIEVAVRVAVAQLIDAGDPYSSRADDLIRGAKLDLAFAKAMDGKRLSFGDYVAHSVSVGSIEGIMSALKTLDPEFPALLRSSHARWTEERDRWPLSPIIEDYDQTAKGLKELFRLRNIAAHELPIEPLVSQQEVYDFLSAAQQFVEAIEWYVVDRLLGSVPLTQNQMNIDALDKADAAKGDLEQVLSNAKELKGINVDLLNEAQAFWEKAATLEAELVSAQVEGGSMQPLIYSATMEQLVQDRVTSLQRIVDEWMDP